MIALDCDCMPCTYNTPMVMPMRLLLDLESNRCFRAASRSAGYSAGQPHMSSHARAPALEAPAPALAPGLEEEETSTFGSVPIQTRSEVLPHESARLPLTYHGFLLAVRRTLPTARLTHWPAPASLESIRA